MGRGAYRRPQRLVGPCTAPYIIYINTKCLWWEVEIWGEVRLIFEGVGGDDVV